jgi:hypothetical protein
MRTIPELAHGFGKPIADLRHIWAGGQAMPDTVNRAVGWVICQESADEVMVCPRVRGLVGQGSAKSRDSAPASAFRDLLLAQVVHVFGQRNFHVRCLA